MKRILKLLATDGVMALLLYVALFTKVPYAETALQILVWAFIVLYFLVCAVFNNEKCAAMIRAKREPMSKLKGYYSFIYDVTFAIVLASQGYLFTALVWWTLSLIAKIHIERMDKEIRIERGLT